MINPEKLHKFEDDPDAPISNGVCGPVIRKFKQYSEACGLGNPKDWDRHIRICESLSNDFGIHVDKIYLLFSMSASRLVDKLGDKSGVRQKITVKIADSIKNNERVTKKMVEFWLYESGDLSIKQDIVNPRSVAKRVNIADFPTLNENSLTSKIKGLKAVLTTGQLEIVRDVMVKYDKDNELSALSMILVWGKQRMKGDIETEELR